MKYLLQAIDARRDCVRLSDHELRDLLIEVRNGKDDKIEFTESMVRLLDELKSSEHASAFLTKVAKRDAPDYYEVIKNPMDLGTMMRNVRQGRYKSKAQFMRDLDLIWDNCLTYNSEPTHPLRRSVQVLRNKANHLLTYVNDTNDVKEALNQWQASLGLRRRPSDVGLGEEGSLLGGDKQAASLGASGERNGSLSVSRLPVATLIDTPFEQRPALLRNCDNMSTFERINASQVELDKQFARRYLYLNEPGPSSQPLRTLDAGATVNTDVADLDMLKTLEGAQGSVLRMALTTAPKRVPAQSSDDQQMTNGDVPHPETEKEDEEIPYPLEAEDVAAGEEEEGQSSQSALFDTASAWWNSMSHPSMLPAGVSHLLNSEQTESKRLRYITGRPSHKRRRRHTADAQPHVEGRKYLAGGAEALERNVKTISRLRRTHTKYARLHGHIESGDPIPADLGVVSSEDENDNDEDGAELANGRRQNTKSKATKESRKLRRKTLDTCLLPMGELAGNPFVKLGSEAATNMLQNKTNLLLAHAGFDASQKNASDVVADIASEFLMNVGRTMRNYVDRFSHDMSVEELILHTLFENGGTDVRALESYVADDVVRYGHKMSELLRKLRASYRDTLAHSDLTMADEAAYFGAPETKFAAGQAGGADSAARQDGAEEDEHILRGGYAMELADEDFFGFKDMGLDQELGMDVGRQLATMPSRMFSRRAQEEGAAGQAGMAAKNRFGPGSGESGSSIRYDFEPPAPLIALSEAAVGAQIGLLRGYYRELFRTRGQWQRTGNENDPANSQGDAANGDQTVTQADTTQAPPTDEDGVPKDAYVILLDEEQERQRYKVPPTGKMPRRAMKERSTVSSQAQASSRQSAATAAANGKSSTAANGSSANGARGKAGGAGNGSGGASAKNAASTTKAKASNGSSKKKKDTASKAQPTAVTVG